MVLMMMDNNKRDDGSYDGWHTLASSRIWIGKDSGEPWASDSANWYNRRILQTWQRRESDKMTRTGVRQPNISTVKNPNRFDFRESSTRRPSRGSINAELKTWRMRVPWNGTLGQFFWDSASDERLEWRFWKGSSSCSKELLRVDLDSWNDLGDCRFPEPNWHLLIKIFTEWLPTLHDLNKSNRLIIEWG